MFGKIVQNSCLIRKFSDIICHINYFHNWCIKGEKLFEESKRREMIFFNQFCISNPKILNWFFLILVLFVPIKMFLQLKNKVQLRHKSTNLSCHERCLTLSPLLYVNHDDPKKPNYMPKSGIVSYSKLCEEIHFKSYFFTSDHYVFLH